MIKNKILIELLNKYEIDGEKLIKNNQNILEYGDYEEIKKILNYLINEIKCTSQAIEKCPSILYLTTKENIKDNYEYLITTKIDNNKIKNTLDCLNTNLLDLKYNYEYLIRKIGEERLNKSLSCLKIKSIKLVNICKCFENKYGNQKLKECIYGISKMCSNTDEIEKILNLDILKKHPDLLTPSIFLKSADEIEKILNLDVFKEHSNLLTPNIFRRDADEIIKIINLDIWKKYPDLLTPSIFAKTAEQIIEKYIYITKELDIPEIINRTTMFGITKKELKAKLNFLKENNIPLVNNKGKVNSIFGMNNKNIKEKYNITKKELMEKYSNEDSDEKEIVSKKR